ncbi:rhodanese-like domain-containing protein [Streptomyces sp. NBC_00576]|uniref:rhodanese-like domain-containing protein n=1 Tax=Streptomyces sp. NBC_00576 TaxID=2903665 RepID=UPI002E818B54|nr:rhodanese-like domain-containing protein [Streptomyces sp. NBC_00576]WUB69192.1 rhodanese-like domain-containing protein [Streptomyces sp. NBC_00576]
MYFVDRIDVPGLGNRGYLAGGPHRAVVIDPPRDIDRVIEAAARRGVRVTHVVETHVHNDYVTGGPELARITGAAYLVPAGARVAYDRVPITDGDSVEIEERLTLRALATPGHTPHHTAYVLEEDGLAVAVFTGGSLLIGTVGRPDLVEPRLTGELARAQCDSAHRLAAELPDETAVLPTHGFGSFCSAGTATGDATTIGRERVSNEALVEDADTFVAQLLAGLDDVPAYYAHMGPVNSAGPAPVDLTPPGPADAVEIAARLAAGEWVVDLRNRVAFAEGHVAGSVNFEAAGQLATYLAWLLPWGKPVTLLAESTAQLADAQRELVRVGIDRPAAASTGSPAAWLRPGEQPRTFPRATFADLAEQERKAVVVLDVRRDSERAGGHIAGSLHIPLHQMRDRLAEIPDGTVWVHCAGGMRAAIAASLLDAAGRVVVAVDDGFAAAREAGLPMARVTPAEALDLMGADGAAVLLDVREAEEWEAGHAAGAVHAPLSALAAGAALPGSARSRPLIVICRSGKRSREAAALLAARGAEVADVIGGMRAWTEAGLPVATGNGLRTDAGRPTTTTSEPPTDAGPRTTTTNEPPTDAGKATRTTNELRADAGRPVKPTSEPPRESRGDGGPVE